MSHGATVLRFPVRLAVDKQSPIPIRRQLTEQLKHVIEGGGLARDEALPSIRELAGFLGINPNTIARVIEDLKRSGYVESRAGKGVFVAPTLPAGRWPNHRQGFLRDVVIRAAALGMTPNDVAVGVLGVAGVRPAVVQGMLTVLLVECSLPELDFFAAKLEAELPVRVDKVLLKELTTAVRRRKPIRRWAAAVTSLCHFPVVERRLQRLGVPVIALLVEAHLETLHSLAQLRPGTRVGVIAPAVETSHSLADSIARAGLPNITLVGACAAEGAGLRSLIRRVDVLVCPSSAAERVRELAAPRVRVIIDERALDPRAIEMLATVLVQRRGERTSPLLRPGGA